LRVKFVERDKNDKKCIIIPILGREANSQMPSQKVLKTGTIGNHHMTG
jgi:hypothetical protein